MSHRTIDRMNNRMNHRKLGYAYALGASLLVLFALMFAASIVTSGTPLG